MAIKKQFRHKGPVLAWRRPKELNELWEAAAPGGGRYVIRMIGAYRTGATRYDVHLSGASQHSSYIGDFKTADAAKRVAGAHANRLAVRAQAVAVGPTTRGPWDPDGGRFGGKRRKAASKKSRTPTWVLNMQHYMDKEKEFARRLGVKPKRKHTKAKRRATSKPSGALSAVVADINRLTK